MFCKYPGAVYQHIETTQRLDGAANYRFTTRRCRDIAWGSNESFMTTQLFNRLFNGSFRPTVDRDTYATGQKLLCSGFTMPREEPVTRTAMPSKTIKSSPYSTPIQWVPDCANVNFFSSRFEYTVEEKPENILMAL